MKRKSFLMLGLGILLATSIAYSQSATAVNLTGKWVFQVDTGAGTGTPTVDLKQDGEKLTGHYSGQLGEVDLTGTVTGQTFNFLFTTNIQGVTLTVTYKGTIENKDSIKGAVVLGEFGEGTFTGKRQ